ncbi:SUMF1/EgtB/PvdO family nonheme iron enzyme [Planctomycetota bacterium]
MRLCFAGCVLLSFGLLLGDSPVHAVEFDLLSVGDVNNPADHDFRFGRFGTVRYEYDVPSNEVTIDQYVEFLNAVAKSDPHQLFDPKMQSSRSGIISRSGSDGDYSYEPFEHYGNKPVGFISYWDAARFANWMHNGQPTGPQNDQTTEDGAYDLGGVTYPENESVHRKPGAKWFLPSENEWYKAAHFDPRTEAQGGPPGDDFYWSYGTMSDTTPGKIETNEVGDVINPGPNVANYDFAAVWGGRFGNPATAGSAGSKSYYGVFDAAGSMWEWNESIIRRHEISSEFTFRGNRGASWDDPARLLPASMQGFGGVELCGTRFLCFTQGNGFRLATIQGRDAADFDSDGVHDVDDIDLLAAEIRSRENSVAMDINLDGKVDSADHRHLVLDLVGVQFGDSNLDGSFNSTDFVKVFQYGEYEDSATDNSTWRTGDWNGDGDFDSRDFVIALQNSIYESTAIGQVPEPTGIGLAVAGLLWIASSGRVRVRSFS